jgi:hypothetical protein
MLDSSVRPLAQKRRHLEKKKKKKEKKKSPQSPLVYENRVVQDHPCTSPIRKVPDSVPLHQSWPSLAEQGAKKGIKRRKKLPFLQIEPETGVSGRESIVERKLILLIATHPRKPNRSKSFIFQFYSMP